MDNVYGMGVIMEYQDNNATTGLISLGDAFDSARTRGQSFCEQSADVNSAISGLGQAAATLTGVGIALTAAGDKAMDTVSGFREAAKSYESELATLKFATQATGEEWDKLVAKAEAVGLATQFSPEEAVQGLYELTSIGLTNMQAIEALNATMDFSTMSNGAVSIADSAQLIGSTINKFNLSATEEQVEHIADVFAVASRVSAFAPENVSSFINSIGSMPASLGVTLEEVMSLGSLLVNIGQGSAQAGATVQGFGRKIKQLSAQMKSGNMKGQKASALSVLGIDESTFWTAEGQLRSMVDIFQDLLASTANLSQEEKLTAMQTVFGDQANNLLTAMELSESAFMIYDEALGKYVIDPNASAKTSLDEMIKQFKDCNGVVADGAEMMRNTAKGTEELANGAFQTLQIKLGEVSPKLDIFADKLKYKVSTVLIDLIDKHPKLAQFATTLVSLGGGLLKIAGVAVLGVAGLMGIALSFLVLYKNMATIKVGITAFKGFLSTLPGLASTATGAIGSLITSILPIIAVIGLLALVWKTDFMGIRTSITQFVDHLKESFSTAKTTAKLGIDDFLSETRRLEESGNWWDRLALKVMDFMLFFQGISEVWDDNTLSDEMFTKLEERGLLPLIEKLLDFKQIVLSVCEGIQTGWTNVSETFEKFVSPIVESIGEVWEGIIKLLGIDLSDISKAISDFFGGSGIDTSFWEGIGEFIGTVLGGALGIITSVVAKIAEIASEVIRIAVFVGTSLLGAIKPVIEGIKDYVSGLIGVIKGIIQFIKGVFTGDWKSAWEGVKNIFGGIFQSLSALVKMPLNAVIGIINGAIRGINKLGITIPDWVPLIGGKSFKVNVPEIPMLAQGTSDWQGGIVQISEKGGEIVDLPNGSRVYPHDETVEKAYTDGASSAVNALISKIDRLLDVLSKMPSKNDTGSSSVVFEAGSIVAKVDNANVEDLEELVDKLIEIIRRKQEIERIRSYA